jgi:hypothetical protein
MWQRLFTHDSQEEERVTDGWDQGQDIPFKGTPPVAHFLQVGATFLQLHHLPIVYSNF